MEYENTMDRAMTNVRKWCLNPCFNGILKYTVITGWSVGVKVLILVLMEYENTI